MRTIHWQVGVLMLIAILLLAGCKEETPEQAVINALQAIKKLDEKAITKYFGKVVDIPDDDITEYGEYVELVVQNLDFKVLSSSKDGDTAIVKTEITNIDMIAVLDEYLDHVMISVFSGQDESEDEMVQLFVDLVSKEDNNTVTSIVDIHLEKKGRSWILIGDEYFEDAILGGMASALN